MVQEVTPLLQDSNLPPSAHRHPSYGASIYSSNTPSNPNDADANVGAHAYTDADSDADADDDNRSIFMRAAKFSMKRFWWFAIAGFLFMIVFELSFLPRTSLSRDLRRWYKLKLTKNDVIRDYLLITGIGRRNVKDNIVFEDSMRYSLGNYSKLAANSPTNLAADNNLELVKHIEKQFLDYGLKVKSFVYETANLNEPESAKLQIFDSNTNSIIYNAKLREDPNSQTPLYNAYGYHGSANGSYLFVNYGLKEDYELILQQNIEIAGKIVLVKLESSTTNKITIPEKLLLAYHYGAQGFLIYSDLIDSSPYDLQSSFRVERASLFEYNISIPSLPISYKIATPILSSLGAGTGVFKHWSHNPCPYSQNLQIYMATNFTEKQTSKLINVVGKLPGILKDSEVIIGASRDSFTSNNPLSNHAILIQIIKSYQRLYELGWRPLRSIKFVSWDGTHSGLIGSQNYFNDINSFDTKMPVNGYIHIEADSIRGSHLQIDSNPQFNHILWKLASYVPFPKDSAYYKALGIDNNNNNNNHFSGTSHRDKTTLFQYWKKQDNNTINSIIGDDLKFSDAFNFQQHLSIPVINFKFDHDPKKDPSIYPKNSAYYTNEWINNIDNDMILHGSLVRFIGLIALTLSDHEVICKEIVPYSRKFSEWFSALITNNFEIIDSWAYNEVPKYWINKEDIYLDLKNGPFDTPEVIFQNLTRSISSLLEEIEAKSIIYDSYNKEVQQNLIKDYAWYHSFMKISHYAKFKVANYKALRLENELLLNEKDYAYLERNSTDAHFYNHVVYGSCQFDPKTNSTLYENRDIRSVYSGIQSSMAKQDYEASVKWLAVTYRKLKGVLRKIS